MSRGSGEGRGGAVWKGEDSRCSAGALDVGVRQYLRSRPWGSVGVTGDRHRCRGWVEGKCGSVVTCGVWRGCTGADRGRGKGGVRAVERKGWGYGTLQGVRVHEVLLRCSRGAAKPAYRRRALRTPNISFHNTVFSVIGVHGLRQASVAAELGG